MASLAENRAILDAFGDRVIKAAQANLRKRRQIRGRSVNRIDTGNLRDKLTYNYFKSGSKIIQWFGVPANDTLTRNYADVIEKGRRPNDNPKTWPPVGPIYAWMERKGLFANSDGSIEDNQRLARQMAKSIGKRGIVGVYYMRDALQTELRKSGKEFREFYTREILKQLRLKADKYIK
jgi:hypothetical protein